MLMEAEGAAEDADVRAQILTCLLDAAGEGEGDEREKWYTRLLDLYQEAGKTELALATVVRAATELPTVDAMWDRAEELARTLRRPDEVATVYQTVLAQSLAQEQGLALGERAVAFFEEWFEDQARTVGILERVLEIDPTAEWAFDRLKLLFNAAERWDDLFTLFDRALPAADRAKKIEILEDAAQVAKDFADRPDRAIGYLEQLLVAKPNDARLSASLERLYERQGRHRELVQLLGVRLPQLARKDAQKTRERVARLYIDELGEPGAALTTIEELLATATESQVAAESDGIDVCALLERILTVTQGETRDTAPGFANGDAAPPSRRGGRRDSVPPPQKRMSVRQRAAGLLRDRYGEPGRENDLVRILEIELEAVKSAKERIRRHHQNAGLYAELGNDLLAMEQYVALVTLEPDVATHRVRLAELAEKVGRFDRLAEVLAAAADDCTDDVLRVELLMQAGIVQADRIGDGDRAIDLLSRVLAMSGVAPPQVLSAARRLEPLLDAARRPRERLTVLERIATLEPDVATRRATLGAAARLATELDERERAILAWEARLTEDGEDVEALDGLVDLLERARRYPELCHVLDKRARAPLAIEKKRADRVRIASLYAVEIGDADLAIRSWREVEREFGESDESTRALAMLLRATSRWGELAGLLERGAARAEGAGKAEFFRQLGDVEREKLEDPRRAVQSYASALDADVENTGARAGLHALLSDPANRAAAVDVLMKAYEATDAWQLMLDLTGHRLASAQSDGARLKILLHAAQLSEHRARDAGLAFEAMRRAFLLAPESEGTESELDRLAATTGEWKSLADAQAEVLARADEARRDPGGFPAQLRVRLGRVLEDRLRDPRAALSAYARVVDDAEPPLRLEAARAAIRVAGSLGRWDAAAKVIVDVSAAASRAEIGLVEALEDGAQLATAWDAATSALAAAVSEQARLSPAAARDLEARIAAWHKDRRGDPDAAEAALVRALVHDAMNPELLGQLAQLQRRVKGRPLVDSLLRLSQATGGDLELLREAAEIAQSKIGDRGLAKSILEKLMALGVARWTEQATTEVTLGSPVAPAPFVEWSLEELVRIHEEEGELGRAVDALVSASKLPFSPEKSRAFRHRAASVAAEKMSDTDCAISLFSALFEDDPEDAETVRELVALYTGAQRPGDLLMLRERQIVLAKTQEKRSALRLEAARLLSSIGDHERAVATLRENLGEAPRDTSTVQQLVRVLESLGRYKDLWDLLVSQAASAEEAGEMPTAAELWARAALVAEERLRDRDAAAVNHERVVAIEPRPSSFDALARLASARGDHGLAARFLSRLYEVAAPEGRAPVMLRLADALVASGKAALAEQRLEEACEAAPAAEDLRARLVVLYKAGQKWQKLAKLLTVAAAHAPDKAARLARLREAAVLLTVRCGAPDEAIPLLEQASDLEPSDQSIRLALADALAASKRFEEARVLLRTLIDGFAGRRPKERAPVHYHLAQLELAMGNRARALVELDAATRIDPANPEILRTLAELARDDGQLDRAERSYRALLVVLRRQEDGPADTPIARSCVLLELSGIAARQGQDERAKEILESALEAASRSEFEEERLLEALRAKGEWETLVRALEAKLARAHRDDDVGPTLGLLAEVLDEKLGRAAAALPLRLRAVAEKPDDDAAHDAALGLARRGGFVPRYVASVRDLAAVAEAAANKELACAMLLRLGHVLEDDAKDDCQAAEMYERALTLGERVEDVLSALDLVYERLGDTAAQDRVLSIRVERLQRAGSPAASDAVYRLAALRLLSPATIDQGCELLSSALDKDPQLDRAEAALRRAVELAPSHERTLALYESVGRSPGHERALVDALTRRAELPGGTGAELREAVEVARSIGDATLAESLLTRFIEGERTASQNVSNLAWALATLAEIREASGDLRQAVDLKKAAAGLAEPETSRRLSFEVAKLATGPLGDQALAAETYEALCEKDPADRDAWEPLLEVYRRTLAPLRASGAPIQSVAERLAALLGRVVDYVDDSAERSRLRFERVRVMMEDLGLGDEAAGPLREIVDDDPTQVEAAMMLANILERHGNEEELCDLLAKQMEAARDRADGTSVASLALRLGARLEKKDPVGARNVYYTGLDWDAQNRDILRALLRLFQESGEAADRADITERLLATERGPAAEELALALHALRAEQWDDAGAERALELGFKGHPASVVLRQRLEAAYRDRKEWKKLAELCVTDARARFGGPRARRAPERGRGHPPRGAPRPRRGGGGAQGGPAGCARRPRAPHRARRRTLRRGGAPGGARGAVPGHRGAAGAGLHRAGGLARGAPGPAGGRAKHARGRRGSALGSRGGVRARPFRARAAAGDPARTSLRARGTRGRWSARVRAAPAAGRGAEARRRRGRRAGHPHRSRQAGAEGQASALRARGARGVRGELGRRERDVSPTRRPRGG